MNDSPADRSQEEDPRPGLAARAQLQGNRTAGPRPIDRPAPAGELPAGQGDRNRGDVLPAGQQDEDAARWEERQEYPAPGAGEYPGGPLDPPGALPPSAGASVTGAPVMAAWPPMADRIMSRRYLVTAPPVAAEEGEIPGDAAADLQGATPYANFIESREGPNGTTWLVTVSEADSANFLAQAANVHHTVQELRPDGNDVTHVLGDEGTGWVSPAGDGPGREEPGRPAAGRDAEQGRVREEAGAGPGRNGGS